MLSQALNRAMPHSHNQLEGVNRKKLPGNILFSCSIALYIEAVNLRLHCSLKQYILYYWIVGRRHTYKSKENLHKSREPLRISS